MFLFVAIKDSESNTIFIYLYQLNDTESVMVNYILFDDQAAYNLRPLTFFRPVSALLTGIIPIYEKWEQFLPYKASFLTEEYLQNKFPLHVGADNYLINGSVLPNHGLVAEIMSLQPDTSLVSNDILIAIRLTAENLAKFRNGANPVLKSANSQSNFRRINHTWDLISGNEQAIADDYQMITHLRKSEILPDSNHLLGDNLFISEGCEIYNSTFDTRKGPIYIGKCVEIMPGCHIQGPAAICDHATLKMGSLIYKGTTIGPWCKAGGEISNSIFTGYSSKAHDGFLGDSVISEWCNLGAGTTTSNLKNNYEQVKQWSYTEKRFVKTGLQFCGLVMGDHCKTGISTMFNSGTTTGVCSNIFGIGYHRNFIPSFVWGGTAGFRPHKLTEAIETAKAVYKRRKLDFDNTEEQIFTKVFEITANDRTL